MHAYCGHLAHAACCVSLRTLKKTHVAQGSSAVDLKLGYDYVWLWLCVVLWYLLRFCLNGSVNIGILTTHTCIKALHQVNAGTKHKVYNVAKKSVDNQNSKHTSRE